MMDRASNPRLGGSRRPPGTANDESAVPVFFCGPTVKAPWGVGGWPSGLSVPPWGAGERVFRRDNTITKRQRCHTHGRLVGLRRSFARSLSEKQGGPSANHANRREWFCQDSGPGALRVAVLRTIRFHCNARADPKLMRIPPLAAPGLHCANKCHRSCQAQMARPSMQSARPFQKSHSREFA